MLGTFQQNVLLVEGHDDTILNERPSEFAPLTPTIQEDVRASDDRLLDPHLKPKEARYHQELCQFHFTIPRSKKSSFGVVKKTRN